MGMSRLDFAPFTRAWHPIIGGCSNPHNIGCQNCIARITAIRRGLAWDANTTKLLHKNLTNPLTAQINCDDLILACPASDMFCNNMTTESSVGIIDFCFAVMSLSNARFVLRTSNPLTACSVLKSPSRKSSILQYRLQIAPDSLSTFRWPIPNIIIGTMNCSNFDVEQSIKILPNIPAEARAIFLGPLIGNISDNDGFDNIDWIVVSGSTNLRPKSEHYRSIRDIALKHEVPFYIATWGENIDTLEVGCYQQKIGSTTFAYLDGKLHHEIPDLEWTGNSFNGDIKPLAVLDKLKKTIIYNIEKNIPGGRRNV